FACKHAQRIHELLVYVQDTCPNAIKLNEKKVAITPKNKVKKVRFAEPLTSSSNIKQVELSKTSDSNTLVLSSTVLKCSTSSSKQSKIVESKNANHSKPNHTWGSNATDIPSSSSLVMTGCPDCSLVSGLRMFETHDREPLLAHELPCLYSMTSATSSSGLVPNPVSQQPFQEADAPRAMDLADSPVSTLIDQDAPSLSTPSTQEQEQS
ncbi:hypothetical protein Tco_0045892, partial [Tanacetum coccineum]